MRGGRVNRSTDLRRECLYTQIGGASLPLFPRRLREVRLSLPSRRTGDAPIRRSAQTGGAACRRVSLFTRPDEYG